MAEEMLALTEEAMTINDIFAKELILRKLV